jgi:hypothetical protein
MSDDVEYLRMEVSDLKDQLMEAAQHMEALFEKVRCFASLLVIIKKTCCKSRYILVFF